jgi:K+ transporter
VILLRADNDGEGGTLALMALTHRAVGTRGAGIIILLGIISGALFYGSHRRSPCCLPSKVSRSPRRRSSRMSCR